MARAFSAIAEELVYRVFTTMVPTGSKGWDAVKEFSEGLRAYRRTLTTDMNKQINLREAENHFFTALSHDKYFAQCSHNLGVVYQKRDKKNEAKACFERAITDNPTNANAAYALSLIHQLAGQFEPALEFAERAIAHAPRDMRAWNMKGVVWRRLQPEPESTAAWRSSLKFREKAAALAWRDLCRAAWRGQPLDVRRKAIVMPFQNLAVARFYLNNFKRGFRILRQAIWQRQEASLYFELGKGLRFRKHGARSRAGLSRALKAYRDAVHFAPTGTDHARYCAYIAETSALIATFKVERMLVKFERFLPEYIRRRIGTARRTALQACETALASPSITDEETRSRLSEACQILHEFDRCRVIERIGKALDAIKAVPSETNAQQLERISQTVRNGARRLPPEVEAIIAWTQAVFDITLGDLLIRDQQTPLTYRQSDDLLRKGVSRLEKHFPAEDKLVFANERLAETLRCSSNSSMRLRSPSQNCGGASNSTRSTLRPLNSSVASRGTGAPP